MGYEIAIDAYPQELGAAHEQKMDKKTGVLTFHMEGIPDGKLPEPKKTEEAADDDDANRKSKNTDEDVSKDKAKQAKQEKKDKKDAEKLLTELQLTEFHKDATVSKDKEFPLTASQFFEATN